MPSPPASLPHPLSCLPIVLLMPAILSSCLFFFHRSHSQSSVEWLTAFTNHYAYMAAPAAAPEFAVFPRTHLTESELAEVDAQIPEGCSLVASECEYLERLHLARIEAAGIKAAAAAQMPISVEDSPPEPQGPAGQPADVPGPQADQKPASPPDQGEVGLPAAGAAEEDAAEPGEQAPPEEPGEQAPPEEPAEEDAAEPPSKRARLAAPVENTEPAQQDANVGTWLHKRMKDEDLDTRIEAQAQQGITLVYQHQDLKRLPRSSR
eukprot:9473879-Pyramimonas_sp.AAC.1